jgi:hypothetical protein
MMALNLEQLPVIRLGSLGLSFHAMPPGEIDIWADHPLLPPGTLLISPGSGGWDWGERFMVHEKVSEGYLVVDLRRGFVVEMSGWEIAASFVRLFCQETYPFKSIKEAQTAVRAGIPLFSAQVAPQGV